MIPDRQPASPTPPQSPVMPPADQQSAAKSATEAPIDPNSLTPEEQMARFEQELKETDWGHQPC